jgi:membrane-bound lytic murein transglycosylase B
VVAFSQDVAQRRGLDPQWVQAQLAQARRLPAVQRLIMPPPAGTAKNWAAYRARFIDRARIEGGLRFWRTHASWLERAQARWGVPPEVVVAVIGVETFYGRHMGTFRVLDALATLSFDFPSGRSDRSAFFREELEALLALAAREGLEAGHWRGSYAGAMGLPQFMPGSLTRWAVDFDEDGHLDLHTSAADAIGSVAHYLAAFGWRSDLPTHYSVAAPVDTRDRAALLGPDILPTFTPAQFAERGADRAARVRAISAGSSNSTRQNSESFTTSAHTQSQGLAMPNG